MSGIIIGTFNNDAGSGNGTYNGYPSKWSVAPNTGRQQKINYASYKTTSGNIERILKLVQDGDVYIKVEAEPSSKSNPSEGIIYNDFISNQQIKLFGETNARIICCKRGQSFELGQDGYTAMSGYEESVVLEDLNEFNITGTNKTYHFANKFTGSTYSYEDNSIILEDDSTAIVEEAYGKSTCYNIGLGKQPIITLPDLQYLLYDNASLQNNTAIQYYYKFKAYDVDPDQTGVLADHTRFIAKYEWTVTFNISPNEYLYLHTFGNTGMSQLHFNSQAGMGFEFPSDTDGIEGDGPLEQSINVFSSTSWDITAQGNPVHN